MPLFRLWYLVSRLSLGTRIYWGHSVSCFWFVSRILSWSLTETSWPSELVVPNCKIGLYLSTDINDKRSFQEIICGASSEFVSSSIPPWQTLTAHAQQFRRARDLVSCLKVPLDSLLVWASSGGSGETARMRRLAWTFAAHIGDVPNSRVRRITANHLKPPQTTPNHCKPHFIYYIYKDGVGWGGEGIW